MKKILITGHLGYIGPHMVDIIKNRTNYETHGCDIGLFSDNAWEDFPAVDKEYVCDFRDLTDEILSKIDTVIHLAAISNDPMGDLDENITMNINAVGTIEFAKKCKSAGVKKFLMSSSCSIYGKSEKLDMVETDKTEPLTAYAKSKIIVEEALIEMADDTFCVSFLRNSTAYGHSKNLRIDLVVNNFLACAVGLGEIRIMSDGSPWRPLIHCRDIANAMFLFMEADNNKVNKQIINVGENSQNFQVKDVADITQEIFPNVKISYTGEAVADSRDYKVNFDKFSSFFPDFKFEYDLESGMKELAEKLLEYKFSEDDFNGDQFVRLRTLKNKLSKIK